MNKTNELLLRALEAWDENLGYEESLNVFEDIRDYLDGQVASSKTEQTTQKKPLSNEDIYEGAELIREDLREGFLLGVSWAEIMHNIVEKD